MKKHFHFNKVAPIIAIIVTLLVSAACNSNKKYGCPNHLQSSTSVR